MTSVDALADELESRVYMQRLEEPFTRDEYKALIVNAIKRLYVDTGQAALCRYRPRSYLQQRYVHNEP